MKKNFILFALMVFLPVLAFAQSVTLNITGATTVTYNGQDQKPTYRASSSNGNYSTGYYGTIEWQSNAFTYTYTYNGGAATDLTGETEFVNAGTYVITASRKYHTRGSWRDNYPNTWQTATDEVTFTIKPKNFVTSVNCSISPVVFQRTGDECKPTADVVDSELGQLVKGTDFDVDYEDNIDAGTASAIITGKGNYTTDSKTIKFTILANNPGEVISEKDFSTASINLVSPVEYNGTATAAQITSVMFNNASQVFGNDYKIVGYVEQAEYEAYKNAQNQNNPPALPTILAAPNHVSKDGKGWYVLIASAQGGGNPAKWGAALFNVKARALKIDLLEIHKTYGDPDPTLTFDKIDKWASINWAPGDGPTNTTISNFKFKRIDAGEQAYDGDSQLKYTYSLEAVDPSIEGGIIATTIINDVEYPNYTVGVGQSSSLLIDKAPLTLNVTNYWKKFQAADPTSFEYTVVEGLKNGDKLADVKATVTRADGEAVNAHVEKRNNKDVVELNEGEDGYAFEGVSNNYEISFDNAFAIIPTDDYSGIKVAVKNNVQGTPEFGKAEYVYRGTAYEPGKANTAEAADLIVTDGDRVLTTADYQVKSYANNVHAGDATVTVTLKGSYVGTDKSATFKINKAPLKIKAVDYVLQPGQAYPEPLEVSYTGFVNNETPATAKNFSAPTGVEKEEISGTTAFTLKVKQDAKADDYKISYDDGALTFGETILHVTANNKSKIYSAKDPEFDVRVTTSTGAPATDAQIALLTVAGKKVYTLSRQEGEDVGTYTISIDGPTVLPEGVIVKYHEGEFAINVKTVYLRGDAVSKEYGEANPAFDASVWEDNAKWSDEKKAEEGVVNPNFYYVGVQGAYWNGREWVLSSEDVTPANGGFVITPTVRTGWGTSNGITESGNYYVEADNANSGKFTITPAPLTIAADDKSKFYNQADPALTVTVTGLKFRDALVAGRDYTISRKAGEDVGEYAIEVKTVQNSVNSGVLKNYKPITLTNGKFAIKAAALEIVANDQAIYYGQSINPYDVVVKIAGVDQRWNEEKIKAVLKLETEITKVGANKDAYTLVPANNPNYSIAEDAFTNGWLTIAPLAEIPLDEFVEVFEGKEVALTQVLEDHRNVKVGFRMPSNRTFKDNTWYTLVLPFDIRVRDLSAALGYAVVDIFDQDNNSGDVKFKLHVQDIKANEPFIVKVDEEIKKAQMKTINFGGKKFEVADAEFNYATEDPTIFDKSGNSFTGTYAGKSAMATDEYFMARGDFYTGDGTDTWSIKQTEAYLKKGAANGGALRIYIEEPDGTTTIIEGVEAASEAAEAEAAEGWYTVTGVKLEAEPTTTGTYIFNGKKVFIQK